AGRWRGGRARRAFAPPAGLHHSAATYSCFAIAREMAGVPSFRTADAPWKMRWVPRDLRQAEPMRVLYLYCHPLLESFHAAIRDKALDGLRTAGHEVDLLDLYAEKFDPVLSEDGRRHYHDTGRNQ